MRLAGRARVGYALKQSRFGAIAMAPGHCARAVSGLCCFCLQSCRVANAAAASQIQLLRHERGAIPRATPARAAHL
jgi:hypothetical protein